MLVGDVVVLLCAPALGSHRTLADISLLYELENSILQTIHMSVEAPGTSLLFFAE